MFEASLLQLQPDAVQVISAVTAPVMRSRRFLGANRNAIGFITTVERNCFEGSFSEHIA